MGALENDMKAAVNAKKARSSRVDAHSHPLVKPNGMDMWQLSSGPGDAVYVIVGPQRMRQCRCCDSVSRWNKVSIPRPNWTARHTIQCEGVRTTFIEKLIWGLSPFLGPRGGCQQSPPMNRRRRLGVFRVAGQCRSCFRVPTWI